MNSREKQELDRHITGNYGEDQLRDEDYEEGPEPTEEQMNDMHLAYLHQMNVVSEVPTRYAVICREDGTVFLTKDEYDRQIGNADDRWLCPMCGQVAVFDDDNYEGH